MDNSSKSPRLRSLEEASQELPLLPQALVPPCANYNQEQHALSCLSELFAELEFLLSDPVSFLAPLDHRILGHEKRYADVTAEMYYDSVALLSRCEKAALDLQAGRFQIKVLTCIRLIRNVWDVFEFSLGMNMHSERYAEVENLVLDAAKLAHNDAGSRVKFLRAELEARLIAQTRVPDRDTPMRDVGWQARAEIAQSVVNLLEKGIHKVDVITEMVPGCSATNARKIKQRWRSSSGKRDTP